MPRLNDLLKKGEGSISGAWAIPLCSRTHYD